MLRNSAAIVFACLLLSLNARAAAAPLDLYVKGDYDAAIAAGERAADGVGFAVAARAVLAQASLADKPCLDCLKRAEGFARRAVAADPKTVEAYVYLAVALGYEARILGSVQAQLSRFPEQAKTALDTAAKVAPADPWVLAGLGGWNLEIVRNGGSLLARLVYGARADVGMAYFQRALMADPTNVLLPFQYALSLGGYDPAGHRDAIVKLLDSAANGMPRTAYEGDVKKRAGVLLALLRQDKQSEFTALVARYQGYP